MSTSRESPNFFISAVGLLHKTKECFCVLTFIVIVLLSGCGQDQIELPQNQLEGLMGGSDWSYKSANGYLASSNFQYRIRFLSSEESVSDPCSQPSPNISHVKALFKPALGSFFVSPQALDDNQVQVSFEFSGAQSLIASSGFMEVYAIENRVVIGYLQAVLDDENKVEGSFEIRLCN